MHWMERFASRVNGQSPFVQLRNITRGTEAGDAIIRVVEDRWPADHTREEALEFADRLRWFLRYGKGTTVKRAIEAMDPSGFTTFLSRIINLKVLDGYAQPAYSSWRRIVDIVELDNLLEQKSQRFETPGDLNQRSHRQVGTTQDLREFDMPGYFPDFFEAIFRINWETDTIGDLSRRLEALFSNGVAVNRTIEKFVWRTLIEDNPNIQVDDATQALFADAHTGGGDNDLNAAVQAVNRDQIQAAIELMGDQTLDGEPLEIQPRYIAVRSNSANAFAAKEVVRSIAKPDSDGDSFASNKPNVLREDFDLEVLEVPVLHKNSWFIIADVQNQPQFAVELGFMDGEDQPDVELIDGPESEHFKLTGQRRWRIQMAMGGTPRTFHGIVRGSPKA